MSPAHPEEDPNILRETREREQIEGQAIQHQEELTRRRDEAIERSRAAMWELAEQQQREQEVAEAATQQADDIQRVKLAVRQSLVDAAIAWLEEKWGVNRPCPYCGSVEWDVRSPLDEFLADRGPISAHFEVTCRNCGNTAFLDAFKAGLLPEPDELEDSPLEEQP